MCYNGRLIVGESCEVCAHCGCHCDSLLTFCWQDLQEAPLLCHSKLLSCFDLSGMRVQLPAEHCCLRLLLQQMCGAAVMVSPCCLCSHVRKCK